MNAVPFLSWALVLGFVISLLALFVLIQRKEIEGFQSKRSMLIKLIGMQFIAVLSLLYVSEVWLPNTEVTEVVATANKSTQEVYVEEDPNTTREKGRRVLEAKAYAVSEGYRSQVARIDIPEGWKYLSHDVFLKSQNYKADRDVRLIRNSDGVVQAVELRVSTGGRSVFETKSWISANLVVEIEEQ